MNAPTDLFNLFASPEPFARGEVNFWDDPHISEQMLTAHLDPGFEGASRTAAFMNRSAEWITRLAPPAERPALLDVGCGPGLYAERFHDAGYRVTGIDFSRRSIAHARQRAAETGRGIDYDHANYLKMDYQEAFDLAVLIYCDYGALSPAEGAELLARIHRSLRPGGMLLLDAFTPAKYAAFPERRVWERHANGGFWRPDSHIAIHEDRRYDELVTLEKTVVVSAGEVQSHLIWNRYFPRDLLWAELEAAGFRTPSFFGDVAGGPCSEDSKTIAVAASK